MINDRKQLFVTLAVLLCGLLGSVVAYGQNVQMEVTQLNQQAMEAYGNLDIDRALAALKQAEDLCLKQGVSGAPLARTYANMGLIAAAGQGDSAGAMELFKKAICSDSKVMLDPLNTTPDVDMLFKGAAAQIQGQGCDGIVQQAQTPAATTPVTTPVTPVAPAAAPALVANNVLRHMPVVQQQKLVPIPFFVQTNPQADVGKVVLYYRTTGERIFQQLPMTNSAEGWFAIIDCDVLTTLDPSGVEYYIAVLDSTDQLISTAGSEAQPFKVAIAESITQPPPPIPGQDSPAMCQAECPPWEPNCNQTNCGNYADLCSDTEPCCDGLACVGGVCDQGGDEGEGGGEGGDATGASTDYKVRISLEGGLGAGLVNGEDYDRGDFPNMIFTGKVHVPTGALFSKLHSRIAVMVNIPKIEGLELGILARLALPLSPDYSPVVPSILLGTSYSLVGKNPEKGFEMKFVGGIGWMNLMHRVPFDDCATTTTNADGEEVCYYIDRSADGSHPEENWFSADLVQDGGVVGPDILSRNGFRKSGPIGVALGLDMIYWVTPKVGLTILSVAAEVAFPTFAGNLDFQAGLNFRL